MTAPALAIAFDGSPAARAAVRAAGALFPGAPAIDLRPARAAPAIPIGDGLEIPPFLRGTHGADRVLP